MKTAVIVDTAAYLTEEQLKHPDLFVVELPLTFEDGTTFPDTSNLEALREYFKKVNESEKLPSTSQPVMGLYIELLEDLVAKGYEQVFSVHLSSGISGTYKTACSLLEQFDDQIDTYCVDSKAASLVMAAMVEEIFSEVEDGIEGPEIFENIRWMADHSQIYLKVEKLDNLVKGGRVSPALGKIAGTLRIRPVLYFDEDGTIVLYENMRSDRIVYKRWAKLANQAMDEYGDQLEIAFAHSDAEEELEEVKKVFRGKVSSYDKPFSEAILGTVVATYTAEGALGCVFIPRPRKRLQK